MWVESSNGLTLINNAVVGHEVGLEVDAGQMVVAHNNAYWANGQAYSGIGSGIYDLMVEPLFVDPWGGDFRLHGHSPLVDAGINGGAPLVDIFGTRRPLDADGDGFNNVDTGVHEYWHGLGESRKTVMPVSAAPGETLTYQIVLGQVDEVTPLTITMTDPLPAGTLYVPGSLAVSDGVFGESGGVISWTVSLAAGGAATMTFDVTLDPGLIGPLAIVNEATAVTSFGLAYPLTTAAFVDAETLFLPAFTR